MHLLFDTYDNGIIIVNCYCPLGWYHYQSSVDTRKTAECIHADDVELSWIGAKNSCQHLRNDNHSSSSFLVEELNADKHIFLVSKLQCVFYLF